MNILTKLCKKCPYYKEHDENFGYCKKYGQQARAVEYCKIIEELIGQS